MTITIKDVIEALKGRYDCIVHKYSWESSWVELKLKDVGDCFAGQTWPRESDLFCVTHDTVVRVCGDELSWEDHNLRFLAHSSLCLEPFFGLLVKS